MSEPTPWEPEELSPRTQSAFEQLSNFAERRKAELNREVSDIMHGGLVQHARTMFINARIKGDNELAKEWATIGVALATTDAGTDTSSYD